MARRGLLFFCVVLCCVSGARHECDRPCLGSEPPKECFYFFTIGLSRRGHLGKQNTTAVLSVNGQSPGPMISVCQNDEIIVDVQNQLPRGWETAIHWHGFSEGNSPFMDGVPMITQCPVLPGTVFRYRLRAYKTGTFFYRTHSVAQQLDGVHGPLVVHSEGSRAHPEKVIVIAPVMKTPQVLQMGYEQDLNVTALRVDVYDLSEGFEGELENMSERLRIINAAGLDCPVTLFTHTVPLKVVAVDGNRVRPVGLDEVIINPGERVDLLVKSEVMKMTHVVGHNLCKGHGKYGFEPGISDQTDDAGTTRNLNSTNFLSKLESERAENLSKADVRVLLSFDSSVFRDFKGAVDFRYKLGGITPFAPAILTKDSVSLLQFHNKSFLYPPSPLLSQPEALPGDLVCSWNDLSDRCKAFDNGFCECLQVIDLPFNYNLDLFLIDEGKNSNTSQTVHLHGHSFHILSMGTFDRPISGAQLWEKEVLGGIHRNLVNPIKKDTIVVPSKGYVTLRIRPTNPGKWLLESRTSKANTGYGLEVVLNVEDPAAAVSPPEGFPICGNMKEPDLVFTDD